MIHAYLIQCHTNPRQLVGLVNALDAENAYFYIHIDRRSQAMLRSGEVEQLKQRPRIDRKISKHTLQT